MNKLSNNTNQYYEIFFMFKKYVDEIEEIETKLHYQIIDKDILMDSSDYRFGNKYIRHMYLKEIFIEISNLVNDTEITKEMNLIEKIHKFKVKYIY